WSELLRRPPLPLVHLRRGQPAARERHGEQQHAAPPACAHPAGRPRVATAVSSTISKLSEPPSSSAASDAIARPLPRFLTSSRTPPLCARPVTRMSPEPCSAAFARTFPWAFAKRRRSRFAGAGPPSH